MISKVRNYASTYYVLLRHFFIWNPVNATLSTIAVAAIATLYPLPFFVMAQVATVILAGEDNINLPMQLSVTLPQALFLALSAFVLIAVAQFFVERHIIRQNIAWQDALFRKTIADLPRIARFDRILRVPLPATVSSMMRTVSQACRSSALIGRFLTSGVKDVVLVIVALSMLTAFDYAAFVIIIAVSVLCLPIYAKVAMTMLGLTYSQQEFAAEVRPQVVDILRESSARNTDPAVRQDALDALCKIDTSRLYSLSNRQYEVLVSLHLVALLHALVIAGLVFYRALQGDAILDRAAYFVVVLLFVKALLSLAALLSRFMRGYGRLAWLREFVGVKAKDEPSKEIRASGKPGAVCITSKRGDRLTIEPGEVFHVLMPKVRYAFELLPLSNAMSSVGPVPNDRGDWIALIDRAQALEIRSSTSEQEPGVEQAKPAGSGVLEDLCKAGVLAYTSRAARVLQPPQGDCWPPPCDRPVLILVWPDEKAEWSEDEKLIVCDGRQVIAIGKESDLGDRYLKRAGAANDRKGTAGPALVDDDDEEF